MTTFQEKVYVVCRKIPKGKVSTYAEIAKALGNRGYRAVGNALNKNPYAPHVPCHRVVSSNGTLGGFAHGKLAKQKLLENEGIKLKGNSIRDFEKVFIKLEEKTDK